MLLRVRVGQSRPLVPGPDGQGPGAVCRKINGEVGGEIANHLVHRVSVEDQEGGVVSDAVETPLDVLLTNVIVGEFPDKSLNSGLLAFYRLLDLGP